MAISVLALGLGGVACVAAASLFYGEKGAGFFLAGGPAADATRPETPSQMPPG